MNVASVDAREIDTQMCAIKIGAGSQDKNANGNFSLTFIKYATRNKIAQHFAISERKIFFVTQLLHDLLRIKRKCNQYRVARRKKTCMRSNLNDKRA